MKKKPLWKRIAKSVLLLALTICILGADVAPAWAVTQADIDALKSDAAGLADKKKKLEGELDALEDDRAEVLARRKKLDEQVANTSAQIQNVEEQISAYEAMIAQKEEELLAAQEEEAARYELFCKRVRVMEKQGDISYWSVLFNATSFSDMLTRLNDVNEVMESDQNLINTLKALQADISEKKASLEESKAASEAAKADLVSKKNELDRQRQEAIALINEIRSNENKYKATIEEMEREEEEILAKALRLSRELAAQQAAQGKSQESNPGGYIWPVSSRYITSTVGGRSSPGGVGSTNHKGTDIGRVGYTSPIYAAKDGTVIVSQYSSSYGNYVVISHGSGNTTLYGHMSSRKVEAGQYVLQGDVIGITGSTGNSTGPHLHFEITEDGVRINPLSHGAMPQKGYLSGYTLSGSAVSS